MTIHKATTITIIMQILTTHNISIQFIPLYKEVMVLKGP